MEPNTISLRPSSLMRLLAGVSVLLVIASVAGQISKYEFGFEIRSISEMFNINLEGNLPSSFSMLLMLTAAGFLSVIAFLSRVNNSPYISKWALLALGFFFMAFDEGFQVHERFIEPMRSLLGAGELGIFYYAWVVPAFALIVVLGFFFLRFAFWLPVKTRTSFFLAAFLFVGGAIGIELIGGWFDEVYGYDNLSYNLISTVEESFEMAGLIVFIRALVEYTGDVFGRVEVRVG